jgi:CDP-diacylglycerol--glycerol-3-phosphate 3-phosphatidyltransferase
MPSIYDIKPAFQKLLRPLTAWLAAIGVTANEVTVFAALLSAAAGLTLALWPANRGPLLIIPVVLFARMALNAIDGMLAREYHMKTSLGAVLNELGDVGADAALYLPFALIPGVSAGAVVLCVVLGIISEMAGVIAVQIGASRRYDGPMGKSDRAFALGLLALLLGCGVPSGRWTVGYVGLIDGLLAFTIYNRCRRALEELATKRP